jgi:hypothetical protein
VNYGSIGIFGKRAPDGPTMLPPNSSFAPRATTRTPIQEFTAELGDLAMLLTHLLVAIIEAYFSQLPDGVVTRLPYG